MKHLSILTVLVAAAAMSSCSLVQQQHNPTEKTDAEKMPPPLYLGEVQQVYAAQGFALLRIIGPMPKPGVTLITHPVDGTTTRMGNLAISPDTAPRNGMVVADIRAGVVASGDRVFLYRNIAPPDAPESTDKPSEETTPAADTPAITIPTPGPRFAPTDEHEPVTDPLPTGTDTQTGNTRAPYTPPAVPTSPQLPTAPITLPSVPDDIPSHLRDIPDNVDGWN